jgi:hypothetical protein
MKTSTAILIIVASLLGGCSTTVDLYPVDGPLAAVAPLPVIKARAAGITSNSGKITLIMPDGEVMSGRWSVVAPREVEVGASNASAVIQGGGLAPVWGQVYGTTVRSRGVAGTNRGHAMLTGDRGGVLEVEFAVGSGTASGYGVGRDNRGNVYKVIM